MQGLTSIETGEALCEGVTTCLLGAVTRQWIPLDDIVECLQFIPQNSSMISDDFRSIIAESLALFLVPGTSWKNDAGAMGFVYTGGFNQVECVFLTSPASQMS